MTDERINLGPHEGDLDPGSYIGVPVEPESDAIPIDVGLEHERVADDAWPPGVHGEPDPEASDRPDGVKP